MDELFYRLVAAAVGRYLAVLVRGGDPDAARLAAAWRAVLRRHRPTTAGSCPGCLRAKRDMCTVWRVAIGYFLGSGPSDQPRRDFRESRRFRDLRG